MRVRIPAQYALINAVDAVNALVAVLKANGLNPLVEITQYPNGCMVNFGEATIPAGVRAQLKAALLPNLVDFGSDPDITV